MMKHSSELTLEQVAARAAAAAAELTEQLRLIELMRSFQEPSDDPCDHHPAGQALYIIAQSLDRAAEHLHDAVRRRSRFNASGLPRRPSSNSLPPAHKNAPSYRTE